MRSVRLSVAVLVVVTASVVRLLPVKAAVVDTVAAKVAAAAVDTVAAKVAAAVVDTVAAKVAAAVVDTVVPVQKVIVARVTASSQYQVIFRTLNLRNAN
jgi:hypothetical protein